MNIFGIGGAELVLIVIIMLIVAGPKRMIRWAYHIGKYVGKFRIMWGEMVDMLQEEVDAAGLDVKLPKDLPTKQNLVKTATDMMKPYTESLEQTLDEVKNPVQATIDATNKVVADAKKPLQEAADDVNEVAAEANKKNKVDTSIKWGDSKNNKVAKPTSENTRTSTSQSDTKEQAPKSRSDNGFGAWSKSKSSDQPLESEA